MYTEAEKKWISEHYKGISTQELTEAVNKEFGTNHSVLSIRYFKRNHKLLSGYDSRFKKGVTAYNKGKHLSFAGCEKTQYQKGHMPYNHLPVGTLSMTSGDEYYIRKVAEPNVWEFEHRLVWKQAYGEIPKGQVVIFLDRDRHNCNIDNLALVSKGENQALNRRHLRFGDAEATKVAITMIRLEQKIRERKEK